MSIGNIILLCLVLVVVVLSVESKARRELLRRRRLRGEEVEIAWLLSFPNSGTTYTQRLVQATSGRSVASNYGHEMINEQGNVEKTLSSIPVFEGSWSGPFRTAKHLSLPEDGYVLTKTHCGGYCFSDCPPTWYRLSPLKFLQECRLGMRHDAVSDYVSRETWVQYDYLIVKRVVHLLRSPFENIVSRFFHEIKIHSIRKDSRFLKKYPKSPLGFKAWCSDTDTRWKFHEITAWGSEFFVHAQGVPCHGELMRIVRWHNNAFALHEALNVPTLLLHYADFKDAFNPTLKKLLKFLNLKQNGDPMPFLYSNHDKYYLPWERVKMSQFMKFVATPQTLEHLDRYLVNDLEQQQRLSAEQPQFLFYNVQKTESAPLTEQNIISPPQSQPITAPAVVEPASNNTSSIASTITQNKQISSAKEPSTSTRNSTTSQISANNKNEKMIPVSTTQELLFYNNDKSDTIRTSIQKPSQQTQKEVKILDLINHDWQKNKNVSLETKFAHVQAGLQKMSMLSEKTEEGEFRLQFFKRKD